MHELVLEMQLGLSVRVQTIPWYFLNQPVSTQDHLAAFGLGSWFISWQGGAF